MAMKIGAAFFVAGCIFICSPQIGAADDLISIAQPAEHVPTPGEESLYTLGQEIILPGGERDVISRVRDNGQLETASGVVLTQQGIILSGQEAGQSATLAETESVTTSLGEGVTIILPSGSMDIIRKEKTDGQMETASGLELSREGIILAGNDKGKKVVAALRETFSGFAPGAIISLPDNNLDIIRKAGANGQLETASGQTIGKDGALAFGPDKGKKATLAPSETRQGYGTGAAIALPDKNLDIIRETGPDGQMKTASGRALGKDGVVLQGPDKGEKTTPLGMGAALAENGAPIIPLKDDGKDLPQEEATSPVQKAEAVSQAKEEKAEQKEESKPIQTMAEILTTGLPGSEPVKAAEKAPAAKEKAAPKAAKPEAKPVKASAKAETPAKPAKATPGQKLKIPPDAAKTGNLDFLAGCWQGTRPEYRTKTTIKECLCFNSEGKNGRRYIYDPRFPGRFIGGTRARVSGKDVLAFSSSSAFNGINQYAPSDLTCKNSGEQAPCSWVFHGPGGGHQSYVIPFVAVESCGR